MSTVILLSSVHTGQLAKIANQEENNKNLRIVGITLLVISLIGLLIGLGLVISGLLQGTPFVIAGAAVSGTSLVGVAVAALLIGLSQYRSQRILTEKTLLLKQEKPSEEQPLQPQPEEFHKPITVHKQLALESQIKVLKKKIKDVTEKQKQEREEWQYVMSGYAFQKQQLNKEREILMLKKDELNQENLDLTSTLTDLQKKAEQIKAENAALEQENSKLQEENQVLKEACDQLKQNILSLS